MLFRSVRIFVGVFDQRAALFDVDVDAVFAAFVGDLETDRMNPAAVAQRQVARRLGAGAEVLVAMGSNLLLTFENSPPSKTLVRAESPRMRMRPLKANSRPAC